MGQGGPTPPSSWRLEDTVRRLQLPRVQALKQAIQLALRMLPGVRPPLNVP